ncbi:alginate export family protein [Candidatus Omnitrophota bacterium]
MKRLITLCIILTAIALVASPAFAEVQNVKVSGDIISAGVYRNNYDLYPAQRNATGTTGSYDEDGQYSDNNNFLYTQARVRVDADLTDNVAATIRYLTEYDWNTEDNTGSSSVTDGDNVDLDLANVTLKEAFYQPLTVIVGRQPLRYGNAFVVGDPDTNATSKDTTTFTAVDLSIRKSFDAIRGILDYNPLTIDLFMAKIDETNAGLNCDETLYGANAAYTFDNYNAEAEGYWFLNRDDIQAAPVETSDTTSPGQVVHTIGARGSMTPIDNLNILGEIAFQRGDYDRHSTTKRDVSGQAWQVAADYTIVDWNWAPVVRAGWTHYSGEEQANAGDFDGWIPLYEDQSHGVAANFILSGINGGQNSNADILNIGATVETAEDLTLSVDWYNFWLDQNLVAGANTLASSSNNGALGWTNLTQGNYAMNANDELGYEVDVALDYDYTEDVKMGLSGSWFKPGKALEGEYSTDRNDETALQVLATLDVAF